jgi:hypothetical protein
MDPPEVVFPTDHAAIDDVTPVAGPAPMAAPEGPTLSVGTTLEGATSAAGPAPVAAPKGPTPAAGGAPMAAPKGATSAVGVAHMAAPQGTGPPLPFPGR